MEVRVKERLVGAAILVGLIVVLVPEMLSGPQDTHPGTAPAGDGSMQTYTIDLSAPGRAAQQAESAGAKPLPSAQDPQPLALPPVPAETPVAPEAKPEPKPEPQPESNPEPEPAQVPPKVVVEHHPPSTAAQKPPPPAASGWAVQIGSFANRDNAQKAVSELRAKGYKAFISTFGTGGKARHRVRVGPESSRAQAEKLAERLKRAGRQVAVVSHP